MTLTFAATLSYSELRESIVVFVVVKIDLQGVIYPAGKLSPGASPL
jgi:hypothetical protein